ncbi:MAG TPA: hypothetical protein VJ603_07450 [Paucimonas sp.]|nr:hypothetical protein [Paucimonas sp.]HJW57006.1 hypothetical protein [Burkholderiaceae bacterium]
MSEKIEWEVVDAPMPGAQHAGAQYTRVNMLQSMLGRHWKLKVAAMAVAGLAVLVFVLMLAGVALVLMAGAVLLSVGIAKLQRFLRRDRHGNTGMRQ